MSRLSPQPSILSKPALNLLKESLKFLKSKKSDEAVELLDWINRQLKEDNINEQT